MQSEDYFEQFNLDLLAVGIKRHSLKLILDVKAVG